MKNVKVMGVSKSGEYVQLGGTSEEDPRLIFAKWFQIIPGSTFEVGEELEISPELWEKGF